jgi:hypothetical protein
VTNLNSFPSPHPQPAPTGNQPYKPIDIPANANSTARRKLFELDQKLRRQTRANNPQCYDTAKKYISGSTPTHQSKGMIKTREQIARVIRRCQPGGRFFRPSPAQSNDGLGGSGKTKLIFSPRNS